MEFLQLESAICSTIGECLIRDYVKDGYVVFDANQVNDYWAYLELSTGYTVVNTFNEMELKRFLNKNFNSFMNNGKEYFCIKIKTTKYDLLREIIERFNPYINYPIEIINCCGMNDERLEDADKKYKLTNKFYFPSPKSNESFNARMKMVNRYLTKDFD